MKSIHEKIRPKTATLYRVRYINHTFVLRREEHGSRRPWGAGILTGHGCEPFCFSYLVWLTTYVSSDTVGRPGVSFFFTNRFLCTAVRVSMILQGSDGSKYQIKHWCRSSGSRWSWLLNNAVRQKRAAETSKRLIAGATCETDAVEIPRHFDVPILSATPDVEAN